MSLKILAKQCLCGSKNFETAHVYSEPPQGEVRFGFSASGNYGREILRCAACGHFLSIHDMDDQSLYTGDYVNATYPGDNGIKNAFERINGLPADRSDNAGRVQRILEFAKSYFSSSRWEGHTPSILDVGSGLCVFLHRMKLAGWEGTALDPDARAVRHAEKNIGVRAIQGNFMDLPELGPFDVICFNKVLEHVRNPVAMLCRSLRYLKEGGFVYVELPDGEAAQREGFGREEFFIDHHHIFSWTSCSVLIDKAGFEARLMERLREPSTKFTLRAFISPPCDL